MFYRKERVTGGVDAIYNVFGRSLNHLIELVSGPPSPQHWFHTTESGGPLMPIVIRLALNEQPYTKAE